MAAPTAAPMPALAALRPTRYPRPAPTAPPMAAPATVPSVRAVSPGVAHLVRNAPRMASPHSPFARAPKMWRVDVVFIEGPPLSAVFGEARLRHRRGAVPRTADVCQRGLRAA